MTEPIKLPPMPMPDGTAYGDNRTIKGHYFMPEKVRAFATLAAEQATAERDEALKATADLRAEIERRKDAAFQQTLQISNLITRAEKAEAERDEARKDRDDVLASYADACKQLLEAEKAGDEARAELARLTTLRPHACDDEYDGEKLYWGKDGDSWICDPLFVHSTHWTPLPDVKEPK